MKQYLRHRFVTHLLDFIDQSITCWLARLSLPFLRFGMVGGFRVVADSPEVWDDYRCYGRLVSQRGQ